MTNVGQALHVMAKDLRESRVVLGVYLAITGLVTLAAVKPGWMNAGTGSSAGVLLLPVFGMIVVASFVQGDSPIRPDAFWASRPLNPSAVLAAKVMLTIAIVLAIPVIGQLAALLVRRAGSGVLADAVATSAWTYTKWLAIAFVAAAMTKDLKSFLLTVGTIPLILLALIAWTITRSHGTAVGFLIGSRTDYYASWSLILAGAAACAALLLYLYRTHDARPRTWAAGLTAVFLLVQTPATRPPRAEVTAVEQNIVRTTFTVDMSPFTGRGQNGLADHSIQLTPDSLPRLQRLALVSGIAILRGRSGETTQQVLDRTRFATFFPEHALTDVTWLNERPSVKSIGLALKETDSVRSMIGNGGIADVQVDGRMLVRVPGPSDTLELREGSSIARNGSIVSISRWHFLNGEAELVLTQSSVPANYDPFESNGGQAEFALVNDRRHEAVVLNHRSGGNAGGWLVLPGVQTSSGEQTYQNDTPFSRTGIQGESISDDWFREAHLVISHWVSVGSYPIHAENANPRRPPPPPPRP